MINNKLIWNKKAISPLIATVLLIGFAIALGALVMNWGKSYVEEQFSTIDVQYKAEQQCELNAKLEIKEIAGRPKLCYRLSSSTNLTVEYIIENEGPKQIEGYRVTVIGADDSINTTGSNFAIENRSLAPGEIFRNITTFVVPSTFGSLAQVEFTSRLNTTGSLTPTLCTKSSLVKSSIPLC